MDYTITLSDTEKKCMEYIAVDVDEWITNAATNRAAVAKQEILKLNMEYCNENSVTIATGEDAQITQAYTLGVIKKLADASTSTP